MSIYLDNAATSFPKPEAVYAAMERAFRLVGASPGRGGYKSSIEASRVLYNARESAAKLLGASDPSRIAFTHSATESINIVLKGVLKRNDHVVTTSMEHNSVARPMTELERSREISITWCNADNTGFLLASQIEEAIKPSTKLVVVNGCSNVTGRVQPFEEIAALCRKKGILFLLDASQLAGHYPLHIENMSIDMLAAPGHKGLFGAPGTGILYVCEGIKIEPLMTGGTGSRSSELFQPDEMPERFESGTPNLPGIAALGAGIEFLLYTGVDMIKIHEEMLAAKLIKGLSAIDGIKCHTPLKSSSVISFSSSRFDPSTIGYKLDTDYDISVRTGIHCAPLAHRTIGTFPAGTVRVSPGFFNTVEDIQTFLQAIEAIIHERKP